jgi:hypothetical protein
MAPTRPNTVWSKRLFPEDLRIMWEHVVARVDMPIAGKPQRATNRRVALRKIGSSSQSRMISLNCRQTCYEVRLKCRPGERPLFDSEHRLSNLNSLSFMNQVSGFSFKELYGILRATRLLVVNQEEHAQREN